VNELGKIETTIQSIDERLTQLAELAEADNERAHAKLVEVLLRHVKPS
jgi:hypothetical protein